MAQDFTGFPAVPKGHTRVFLNRSFGVGRGRLYGPGWAHVPDSLLPTLAAMPDIVRTDLQGAPLPDTVAASVAGAAATALGTIAGAPAIPHPERDEDEDGDGALTNPDEPNDALRDRRAALAEAAEDERTGGQSLKETESHLDTSRTLNPQPGQLDTDERHAAQLDTERATRDARAANQRTAAGGGGGGAAAPAAGTANTNTASTTAQPATKTALNKVGVDELRTLAKDKNITTVKTEDGGKVPIDEATKPDIVNALYDARVSLDE